MNKRRRAISSVLAAIMACGTLTPMSVMAEKKAEPKKIEVERIGGVDRFDTSSKIAQKLKSTKAFIVNGKKFPDALAVGPIAAKNGNPIILADEKHLDIDMLKKDGIKEIVVVGGENTISSALVNKLSDFTVKRVEGTDRYATSLELVKMVDGKNVGVATGRSFPDALASGVLLSAKKLPLLLVDGRTEADLPAGLEGVYTIGGENSVKRTYGKRISGADRYQTSVAIAKELGNVENVVIASGVSFADALAAAPYAKSLNAPIILSNGKTLSNEAKEIVAKAKKVVIVGGTGTISAAVESEIEKMNGVKPEVKHEVKPETKPDTKPTPSPGTGTTPSDPNTNNPVTPPTKPEKPLTEDEIKKNERGKIFALIGDKDGDSKEVLVGKTFEEQVPNAANEDFFNIDKALEDGKVLIGVKLKGVDGIKTIDQLKKLTVTDAMTEEIRDGEETYKGIIIKPVYVNISVNITNHPNKALKPGETFKFEANVVIDGDNYNSAKDNVEGIKGVIFKVEGASDNKTSIDSKTGVFTIGSDEKNKEITVLANSELQPNRGGLTKVNIDVNSMEAPKIADFDVLTRKILYDPYGDLYYVTAGITINEKNKMWIEKLIENKDKATLTIKTDGVDNPIVSKYGTTLRDIDNKKFNIEKSDKLYIRFIYTIQSRITTMSAGRNVNFTLNAPGMKPFTFVANKGVVKSVSEAK